MLSAKPGPGPSVDAGTIEELTVLGDQDRGHVANEPAADVMLIEKPCCPRDKIAVRWRVRCHGAGYSLEHARRQIRALRLCGAGSPDRGG
jgi:hypothetical protein